MTFPVLGFTLEHSYRIIPSKFPPISLFEDVADPADLEAVYAIEALTNPRLRQEAGDLSLVPPEERVSGPGTTAIMSAFTHLNPDGSRFTRGHYGVYYAAGDLGTAIEETKHHRSRFMAATSEPPAELDMRVYDARIEGELHDIRGCVKTHALVYHPDIYSHAQALADDLRSKGSNGIAYRSVRNPGGECYAVFRPPLIRECKQERHLCYVWDGARIADVYEKRALTA